MQEPHPPSPVEQLKEGTIVPGIIREIRWNEVVVDIGAKAPGIVPAWQFPNPGELKIGSTLEVMFEKIADETGRPAISFSQAEQKKNWENILTKFPVDSVVTGVVKAQAKRGLIVSLDGLDAYVPASHIDLVPPMELGPYVGQTYEFKIFEINHELRSVVLSRRARLEEQAEERYQKRRRFYKGIIPDEIRKGVVKEVTDTGAVIDLDGGDGVIELANLSWGRISHPSDVLKVGDEVQAKVLQVNKKQGKITLGLKQAMKNPWDEEIPAKFPVGAKVRAPIVAFGPNGAIVRFAPGVSGYLSLTEMSWTKRIAAPADLLTIGQELEAMVVRVLKEKRTILLSLRQLQPNPWEKARQNYPVGAHIHGKVCKLVPYGAFVELPDGINGMVHVSELSWTRKINRPSEVLKIGEEVDAVVLGVDPEKQQLSLSMKVLTIDPWSEVDAHFRVGQVVTGAITNITSFGAFVRLAGDLHSLVHISQIREEPVADVHDLLKIGQSVTARVLDIDRVKRRLGLSIKALEYGPEKFAVEVAAQEAANRKPDPETPKVEG
jgi:small subunit ribosomal protein S1